MVIPGAQPCAHCRCQSGWAQNNTPAQVPGLSRGHTESRNLTPLNAACHFTLTLARRAHEAQQEFTSFRTRFSYRLFEQGSVLDPIAHRPY